MKAGLLKNLGVFGFEHLEEVILSALVTEDPLLLIGRSGTGKTFLLNSLSEALGLEHRHYNASLVSFDDLVGFPFPEEDKASVRFLETPATVWGAESVLVDEISRCRPEHQNRFFSLIHEKKIQGLPLNGLRYRWAAMNPCSTDSDDYAGSEALDRALADRFGLIVQVGDWGDLTLEERLLVADPSGEGAISSDGGELGRQIEGWQQQFREQLPQCPNNIVQYASTATTALIEGDVRISPRRSRMIARSLLGAALVTGNLRKESVYLSVLRSSIPHIAWGEAVPDEKVRAAHRIAWEASAGSPEERWLNDVLLEPLLSKKVKLLLRTCPSPEVGSICIARVLGTERPERAAAFAMALLPAAAAGKLPIGAEAVNDLARVAEPVLTVDAEISWQERTSMSGTVHPEFARLSPVIQRLRGAKRDRARQLFYWAIASKVTIEDPRALLDDLEATVRVLGAL